MQTQLKRMLSDLESLDAAILVFDADYPIEQLRPKGLRTGNWAARGELLRLIFNILRRAPQPLSALEIARQVVMLKEMDTGNRKERNLMRQRVGHALRKKQIFRFAIVTDSFRCEAPRVYAYCERATLSRQRLMADTACAISPKRK
jgi:hypothetical protein